MHRVELKEVLLYYSKTTIAVPNAPCGVESQFISCFAFKCFEFLMHRVELKEGCKKTMQELKDIGS